MEYKVGLFGNVSQVNFKGITMIRKFA